MSFGMLLVCLMVLMGAMKTAAQCPDPEVLLYYEAPCGSGLNTGQSFTAPTTGQLDSLRLSRCTGTDTRVVIRGFNGTGSAWNQGPILGEADLVLSGNSDANACYTSGGNGFSNYEEGWFTFNNLALAEGEQYILHLIDGAAATSCNLSYDGGSAFTNTGEKQGEDLAFDLYFCPGDFTFGCTDPEACNFDPAATAEDGSCAEEDCAGNCGGTAYDDPICGCISDISLAGQCLGCTDAAACNFDATSTVDNGSCYYPNCDGSCPEFLDYYEAPCGTGLNYGQSFTASITGYLNSITIARCTGVDTRLQVRTYNGDGNTWNQGSLIGEADQVFPGNNEPSDCFVSGGNGFSNYVETTFTFTNMGLEAGNQYVFQLVQGVAATGCNIDYAEGTAFAINGAKPAEDLVFRLSMCPIILNFGCTDATACNFDESANVEDGSCLFLDCAGTCGGDAYLDPDCGCLDSIEDAGSCVGCIDSAACNFDPTATVGDDSCQFPDCHGDCGGSATLSSCGCIGGNTGIPASACINGCLTEVTASAPEACSPGILYGQSFISTENGLLERIRLKTCCALDAQLVLRRAANLDPCQIGGPQEWNSGEILGYSNLNYSVCSGLGACITSMGVEGYIWRDFDFGGIPIQSGEGYVMELISGVAIANCEGEYADGNAFGGAGALTDKDLVFSIHVCNQDQNWGCTDPTSCTFDPQADQNDGSCLYEDCNGECGGEAIESSGCGCIGGSTGIRTEQCVFGTIRPILANDASICPGTLTGQTLTTAADGFLTGLSFYGPSDEAQTLELRRTNGPNAGELVFTTTRDAIPSSCDEQVSGWLQVALNNFPVQAGSGYRLDFLDGYGHRTCSADFVEGEGIQNESTVSTADMAFRLVYRNPAPGELVWGCTTDGFCNYNPDATHDDGSCTVDDCNGDCGGVAYTIEGCGCVAGLTGIEPESCYGCLDDSKCNFDPVASIDDGSCLDYDCNGDCGGTAVLNDRCGCVGGNTGIDPAICLVKCQSDPFLSNYDGAFETDEIGFGGSGQTFMATESVFLTASRFRQGSVPNSVLSFELRAMDGPSPSEGTLLVSEPSELWTPDAGGQGDIFVEWDYPVLLEAGQQYALIVIGNSTQLIQGMGDSYAQGASFGLSDEEATGSDFFFELFTCTDLYGCTDPVACNHDFWATADDESCTYPELGFDCEGNPCTPDLDGDGICAGLDADDEDPFVCIDTDLDGCDDCLSGHFDPDNDGLDDDGDGICNSADNCSDTEAINYASPDNEVCRGECDTAPIYNGIEIVTLPTSPTSEDGIVALDLDAGSLPFIPTSDFDAVQLVMVAYGAAESMTFDLGEGPILVHPGFYQTMVYDAEGCPGVSAAPGGTTFGQPAVTHSILIGYPLCCSGCGVHDLDLDGLCDDEDACTDRSSPNYNHPDNLPCE